MAYIYKITNDINNKVYIGKTEFSVEKRFSEHCKDAFREQKEQRPLYNAMKKYGVEHFHIEEIEETDNPEEREKYWIEYYGSFKYGYNATLGGDGRRYLDYDLVYALYKQGYNVTEIASKLGYSTGSCSCILHKYEIDSQELVKRGREAICKVIIQKDKNTDEILNIFPSLKEACCFLGKQSSGHITDVCKGKRKTAYGYKWEYGN